MKNWFDKHKYIKLQSESIINRINKFWDKLYLEFWGKLFDDFHASRVLPGFSSSLKIELLETMKEKVEVIFSINADSLEKNKVRLDTWITYDLEVFRSIDILKAKDIKVNSVVITKFNNQKNLNPFIKKLKEYKIKVYKHHYIDNDPYDIERILSKEGFWKNDYIKTEKPIVVVTAPGSNSWKLSVCLSQIYNDNLKWIKSWYAKFETFPIWNINLKHPINLAYEAATADINDVNMIDNFHLEAYWESAVSYNRDLELFPILKRILNNVFWEDIYKSPTDMWVNMVWYAITDENIVIEASKAEIIRRYLNTKVDRKLWKVNNNSVEKIKMLMDYLWIDLDNRDVVAAALDKQKSSWKNSMAIKLDDWIIITARASKLMTPPAWLILNALKHISNINDEIDLLSSNVSEPLVKFKKEVFNSDILNLHEVLIALNICAQTNSAAELALKKLSRLNWTDAHSTCILSSLDQKVLKNLWINFTSEDIFDSERLFQNE